ncbi:MAG: beta-lactamase family protein [Thioalkalivibrio sp.]|nr:beta-lactamase family protein [Thioalkalivibrio sp.]
MQRTGRGSAKSPFQGMPIGATTWIMTWVTTWTLVLAVASCAPGDGLGDRGEALPAGGTESLAFGHPDSVLLWTPEQQRAGFPNYDLLFDTREIPASTRPSRLSSRPVDFGPLTYEVDGGIHGVDDFLAHNHVTGLIVVQGGEVLLERYTPPNDPSTRWVSYSVAKSVVSLLLGAAIQDGYIGSVDDRVSDYIPLLEGSAYDAVRIRDVLQMSSGVAWNEDYSDPDSDVSREIDFGGVERLRFLGERPRVAAPGERFNYSTGEIYLVGAVVRAAVGNNLSSYLHQKIWEPFGMEADANWMLVEPGGPEYAGCCISATLRDYARLGLFVLAGDVSDHGHRVLPEEWLAESTTPSPANDGYGYLWWLADDGAFTARGIFGQMIHIDPDRDLVIATHGAWPSPTGEAFSAHRDGFVDAVGGLLDARASP